MCLSSTIYHSRWLLKHHLRKRSKSLMLCQICFGPEADCNCSLQVHNGLTTVYTAGQQSYGGKCEPEEGCMSNVKAHAQDLAEQHESGELIVLPTVWDTWSAGVAAEAGFTGLTVGSHPVADAIGSADGENMDFGEYLDVVRTITGSVGIPVSADVESGYGLEPDELVTRLLEAGAVGANIEDVVHGEGDRVRERREHADYIAGARRAADETGVPFVIN